MIPSHGSLYSRQHRKVNEYLSLLRKACDPIRGCERPGATLRSAVPPRANCTEKTPGNGGRVQDDAGKPEGIGLPPMRSLEGRQEQALRIEMKKGYIWGLRVFI